LKHNYKNIKIIEAANVANENIDAVSVTEHDLLISSEISKSDFYVSALKSISLRRFIVAAAHPLALKSHLAKQAGGRRSVTMQNTKALAGEEDITCAPHRCEMIFIYCGPRVPNAFHAAHTLVSTHFLKSVTAELSLGSTPIYES
jgi:hypothetical protein